MNTRLIKTLKQVEKLLQTASNLEPDWNSKDECYRWIEATLRHFRYHHLNKSEKGIIKQYLLMASGYSRAQITRLIKEYLDRGCQKRKQRSVNGFSSRYTKADIRLLAETDRLHNGLNGSAIKKICERAYQRGDHRYERLAGISISHLYNLRQSKTYQTVRQHKNVTRLVNRAIGIRRKPEPNGQPGFIGIDTVHQGDQDKVKGLYHVNAVDEVTQLPVLEELLAAFPFKLQALHSDNGSEHINYRVAALLDSLHVKFTKSGSRKTNDNALVESKNGAIIRKMLGYAHIPQLHAELVNESSASTTAGTSRLVRLF